MGRASDGRRTRGRVAAWLVVLAALTALLALVALWPTLTRAEQPHVGPTQLEWLGTPPAESGGWRIGPGGFQWGGGSWYALVKRLELEGCRAQVLWMPEQRLGWHGQAPEFVNRAFTMRYGSGLQIPAGPTAVVCAAEPILVAAGPAEPRFSLESGELAWILRPGEDGGAGLIAYGGGTREELGARLLQEGCARAAIAARGEQPASAAQTPVGATRLEIECEAEGSSLLIANHDLGETQMRWLLRPERDPERNKVGSAVIQYGGGSFFQLVSRLAIAGCNATRLTIDGLTYDYLKTNAHNQPFKDAYEEEIAAGTNINILCQDNCDLIYGLDLVESATVRRDLEKNIQRCRDVNFESSKIDDFVESFSECVKDWIYQDDIVAVLRIMPIYQHLCKVDATVQRFEFVGRASGSMFIYNKAMFAGSIPSLWIATHKNPSLDLSADGKFLISVHELCHVHQNWYTFKHYIDHDFLKNISRDEKIYNLWIETPMAQEFNEIIGFTQKTNGDWVLKSGSPYRSLGTHFSTNPDELSAQLCAWSIVKKVKPSVAPIKYTRSPYLTPELEQWIETYIVLPEQAVGSVSGG